MLMQSSLPSSIEAAIFHVSDKGKEDGLCDWMPSAKTWQVCLKCKKYPLYCCKKVEAMQGQDDRRNEDVPCCRKVEAMEDDRMNGDIPCCRKVEEMQEQEDRRNDDDVSCCRKVETRQEQEDRRNDDVPCGREVEAMQKVEDRRNNDVPCISNCISILDRPSTASTMNRNTVPNQVYRRSKLRKKSTTPLLKIGPMSVPASANCPSFITPCANRSSLEHQPPRSQVDQDIEMVKDPVVPIVLCETAIANSIPKNLGIDSINDSCSTSKSIMEIVSDSKDTRVDDTGECSSSSVLVMDGPREDLSARDLCIKVQKSYGLLGGDSHTETGASQEQASASGDSFCSLPCKICGNLDGSSNMLICDHCEEAYHPSCIIPRMKTLPIDEWFCLSCVKKKQKILREKIIQSSLAINNEKELQRSSLVNGGLNPILLMLNDYEPRTTGVRVGKGFQAEVSEWSGPIGSDDACFEPLEIDSSEFSSFQEKNLKRSTRPSPICNWLQCQEVVDRGKGTICGKWRRAPIFEVQTENWECFCAIHWDPAYADCAAPQELETDQVLKQLKHVELLKTRLTAKRSKFDGKKGGQ